MDQPERSQPPRAPAQPDDSRNYQAQGIFGLLVNTLKSGLNHAVTFGSTVRALTSLRVGSGAATLAAFDGSDGTVIADGAAAGFLARDRAGSTKYFEWYENGTIRLLSQQSGDLWTINATTGAIVAFSETLLPQAGHIGLTVAGAAGASTDLALFDATARTNAQAVHLDVNGHLVITQASPPTYAAGTGAGTGPTITVTGTDQAGRISVTTGTTPAGTNATIATILFCNSYAAPPGVVRVTQANNNALNLARNQDANAGQGLVATTGWQLVGGLTALAASTTYVWYYTVTG
jgi:hypothetical protein